MKLSTKEEKMVNHGKLYTITLLCFLLAVLLIVPVAAEASGGGVETAVNGPAWWFWPLILLIVTFIMGVVAVLAGVGGGVLFVPIISGFFPFHLDFVRGAGLLVALSGALAAGPGLLKANLASLRLAIPVALIASTCAIAGASIGHSTVRNSQMPSATSAAVAGERNTIDSSIASASQTPA